MRAPIGFRISSRRKSLKISQVSLARSVGISPSYLNLIENNKREIGGALLNRVAVQLGVDVDELAGRTEQKLLQDLEEAYADPLLASLPFQPDERREVLAQFPASAAAIARLHRAQATAQSNADAYADRLRSDPLLSQLLHRVVSSITAIRSSAEILEEVADLDDAERGRFLGAILRDSRALSDVARNLIGQFDTASRTQRSASPAREIDDMLIERGNYFPELESAADDLRAEVVSAGPFGLETLAMLLAARFGVTLKVGGLPDDPDFPGQYRFDASDRIMWFSGASTLATRQFQLARLYGELAAPDAIAKALGSATLSTPVARRLAARAAGSYLAGAMIFPYGRMLEDAETLRYDIDHLRQAYHASFEQVAHRLVSLRRPGAEGVPFGFLRSDPAGRLTKHFPLPGLLLPNSGHACPLWAIYGAFRTPEHLVRQLVRFSDGSRYLFLARTVQQRMGSFRDQPNLSSVMLTCDVLHADRTVYSAGLDLADDTADIPVGPSCRLCTRRRCPSRQEEALSPDGSGTGMRGPLLPHDFGLGEGR